MKARFPLSTKIFLLAFTSLAMLALVALVFARFQFDVRFNSLLIGPARDRVVSIARQFALDLEDTAPDRREELLQRYGKTYGVTFYLAWQGGDRTTGPGNLPDEVFEQTHRPPPDERGRGRGRGRGRFPEEEAPLPGERHARGPEREAPIFEVSTRNPPLYWVGVGIPVRAPGSDDAEPGFLLMSAPSFFGTPLFFEYKPWLGMAGAMALVFVLCWLPFIRGVTRAVRQMSQATERIAEGRFDQHLPENRGDELGSLAGGINRMAARLSGFVGGQKRFLGDIAHELCAPIARIQFALGILEQRSEPGAVDDLHEEVRQMSSLVAELLSFSRTGMEQSRIRIVPVNVKEIAEQAAARESVRARVNIEGGLMALAEPEYLLRSLANLLRNAARYAGDAGPITVAAKLEKDEIRLTVSDCGPGLPEEEVDQVFTPFYRLERSRNRASGGAGLGLSIVRNCVEACKGTVRCRNRVPSGLEVEIRLPAAV